MCVVKCNASMLCLVEPTLKKCLFVYILCLFGCLLHLYIICLRLMAFYSEVCKHFLEVFKCSLTPKNQGAFRVRPTPKIRQEFRSCTPSGCRGANANCQRQENAVPTLSPVPGNNFHSLGYTPTYNIG